MDDKQRIDVLFTQTNRSVRVEVGGGDDDAELVDTLVTALEVEDPVDAERQLKKDLERKGHLARLAKGLRGPGRPARAGHRG